MIFVAKLCVIKILQKTMGANIHKTLLNTFFFVGLLLFNMHPQLNVVNNPNKAPLEKANFCFGHECQFLKLLC